jgi:hypothetical protein
MVKVQIIPQSDYALNDVRKSDIRFFLADLRNPVLPKV